MNDGMRNFIFTALTLEYTSKAFARGIYYTFHNVQPPYEGSSPAIFITASALAALVFFGSLAGVRQIIDERNAGITARLAASGVSGFRAASYYFIPIYAKQLICACFAVVIALPATMLAPVSVATAAAYETAAEGDSDGEAVLDAVISDALDPDRAADGSDADATAGRDGGALAAETDGGGPDRAGGANQRAGTSGLAGLTDAVARAASPENLPRLAGAFAVMAVLCLFTSSLALFAGGIFKRAESADVLIVTLGIAMAIAGGTVIPYPYLPAAFQAAEPFSFNRWAQKLIAASLFGGPADGGRTVLAVFTVLAMCLFTFAALKNKSEFS